MPTLLAYSPTASAMFLLLLTVVVYLRVASFGFVNHDDPGYVYGNPHVNGGLTRENIEWALTSLHGGVAYWHPITWLSHQLDCQLFGLKPGPHHLTNLWLHSANILLLTVVLRGLGASRGISFVVAALFGVHPLHVESVAWISERKDLLYAFFWLAALNSFLRFRNTARRCHYLAALGCFSLALMSKPTAVTLPGVLILIELTASFGATPVLHASGGRAVFRRTVLVAVPFLIMSLACGLITLAAQVQLGALPSLQEWPLPERMDNALVSSLEYLRKTLWPSGLSVSYVPIGAVGPLKLGGAVLLLTGITALAIRMRRRLPLLLFGWLWYWLTLLPNIGLIQAGPQRMADRYTYLPLVGIFLMVATLGKFATRSRQISTRFWGAFVTLVACSVLSFQQLNHWRDGVALFSRAVAVEPRNWVARIGLGMALTEQQRYTEALPHLELATQLPGNRAEAERRLGIFYACQSDRPNAVLHFNRAIGLDPNSRWIREDYSRALQNLNHPTPDPTQTGASRR